MKVPKAVVVLIFLMAISCASNKEQEKITYTNTDGLKLRYEMNEKNSGWLFINVRKDSLPFDYKIVKSKKRVLDSKSLKYNDITIFEYHLEYLKNSDEKYPILQEYRVLTSLKRKTVFNYESHIK